MIGRYLLLLLIAGATVSAARSVPAGAEEPSAYEMLEQFGFPKGILPVGVTGYTLRRSDGAFHVFLDRDCQFEVDGGYRVTYRRTISGEVTGGRIRGLQGVTVKVFFMGWGVDEVVMADADHLVFHVGPLSQAFTADNFGESPRCRCRSDATAAGVGVANL